MINYTLISPRIAVQKNDFLGSGIPYWPLELAIFSSFLKSRSNTIIRVIDLFGSNPKKLSDKGTYYLQGAELKECLSGSDTTQHTDVFVLYALSYMSHHDLLTLCSQLKSLNPQAKVVVLENSQAVTAYSLSSVNEEFFKAGASALVCGEPYWNWDEIESYLLNESSPQPKNLMTQSDQPIERVYNKASPTYPVPDWSSFPYENYWKLPYSHGPKEKKFFPIYTSRGCPYPCDFCVVPETNEKKWRGRPPEDVVHEMMTLRDQFGVRDFQVEDLNPTIDHKRMLRLCELLIERQAGVRWSLVSGTKAETVKIDALPMYAKAGCKYISISPESGSKDVMKAIGKPFNYEHGLKVVETCRAHGIRTQACFVVGHPAETHDDYLASKEYMKQLIRAGLDEVAVFVISPFAGSKLFKDNRISLSEQDNLISFSPKGRKDWQEIERRRSEMIKLFFVEKLKKGPDLWLQGVRSLFGQPGTKMENLPKRALWVSLRSLENRFRNQDLNQ